MKDCLHYAPMIGAREGELTEIEVKALAAHLAICEACQGRAADLAATEGIVSEGLLAHASARDFAPFLDEVMARVGLEPGRPERSRRTAAAESKGAGGILAWLGLHWKGTTAAVAPVLAAFAVFMYVRSGAGQGHQVASLEMSSEGVSTVLQTADGPVVLLADEDAG
ncbi:anti-sigma factor family protein [Anaeromyxobacter oryzae]|uniref:Zinc-finger domain-containing protein n=1 Tax=Anaeromyxobacter oryzae TaxID=2918170 RepID=A0ABN6MQY0_9BACT|nr:zf-HC2 domain-containing protein [Anaeromyxobacter oryzae]BDG03413.1 hypothetical protein AMOR_24090 [Anaeromyxobacter oryzae]